MESEHSNVVQQQEVEAQQDLTESVSSDTKKKKRDRCKKQSLGTF